MRTDAFNRKYMHQPFYNTVTLYVTPNRVDGRQNWYVCTERPYRSGDNTMGGVPMYGGTGITKPMALAFAKSLVGQFKDHPKLRYEIGEMEFPKKHA